jgi:hypothetical protein
MAIMQVQIVRSVIIWFKLSANEQNHIVTTFS